MSVAATGERCRLARDGAHGGLAVLGVPILADAAGIVKSVDDGAHIGVHCRRGGESVCVGVLLRTNKSLIIRVTLQKSSVDTPSRWRLGFEMGFCLEKGS